MSATGPSIRAVVRVINGNSCGSGSICGHYQGGSLILTNAHVAGTAIGRVVRVEVEVLGMKKLNAKIIRAAYSNSVSADWALLHVEGFQDVPPVLLSKSPPASGSSLYTKGFPRCVKHNGTDITQAATLNNGVLLWLPDAIGGQSGSGVWSDDDNLQRALLTWSMTRNGRSYGAGQLTSEIYRQNRAGELRGYAKMPGLVELPHEFEFDGVDRSGLGDPVVEEGFFSIPMERGVQDFPIWAEDVVVPPTDPGDDTEMRKRAINSLRKVRDLADDEIKAFENSVADPVDPVNPGPRGPTFGL